MRTVRTKVYKFSELSEEAKSLAIGNFRNQNHDLDLDPLNEILKENIIESGFEGGGNLKYSFSYSQGDGISFGCSEFNKLNDLFIEVLGSKKEKTIKCIIDNLSFSLEGNQGRYCYASKKDIDLTLENYNRDYKNIEIVVLAVLEKLENLYIDLCQDLERQGYNYIEELNSDEFISSDLIANDYEFTENGNIF